MKQSFFKFSPFFSFIYYILWMVKPYSKCNSSDIAIKNMHAVAKIKNCVKFMTLNLVQWVAWRRHHWRIFFKRKNYASTVALFFLPLIKHFVCCSRNKLMIQDRFISMYYQFTRSMTKKNEQQLISWHEPTDRHTQLMVITCVAGHRSIILLNYCSLQ